MGKAVADDQILASKLSQLHRGQNGEITVTIVVPVYNEVDSVPRLVKQIVEALTGLGSIYEILLIDDGSTDGTADIIANLSAEWPSVKAVYLARNYGQSTAMQAGFDAAQGKLVITIDGDLQNDPADIPNMISLLEEKDVDVVCGWRQNRRDPPVRKLFSRIANWMISKLTGVRLHDYGCSLKVYRRDVLERTRLYGEMHRFLPALLTEVGAEIREVPVRHHARKFGRSKYGLDRTLRVVLDLCFVIFLRKYLQRPLHVFGSIGVLCLLPGSLTLVYLAFIRLVLNHDVGGRPLLTLGTLLTLIGVMFIGQGLLGELIVRILHSNGGRAHYHFAQRLGRKDLPDRNSRGQS